MELRGTGRRKPAGTDSDHPIVASLGSYCGRFAPSPTGPLHFGSLVAAMASWCDARANGGAWKLRIEDVDAPRTKSGAADAILTSLERYGFQWDGPVIRQSERIASYHAALDALRGRDQLFACACTRKELEDAPFGATGERLYPGTCRGGVPSDRAKRSGRALRVRVDDRPITFVDRVQGAQTQVLARDSGDFVVLRADALFAYQLAVVVDDAYQGVTHVVRGADLLTSTVRQIWLQRCLGLPTPSYLHHPIVTSASGEKLSKQTGAAALPDTPLPVLLDAWTFLEQRAPAALPDSVESFWTWAHRAWDPARTNPRLGAALPSEARAL